MTAALARWWFAPMPRARIAWLRRIAYGFLFVDLLLTTAWVRDHATTPTDLYAPLLVGRLLPLPVPTPAVVWAVFAGVLVAAAAGLSGRAPRLVGWAVLALYLQWMVIAFSYGKVDHDRFGFLVLLAVLPTVGAASTRDRTVDEASGWAIRCVQVACVATYLFAVWGKLRFGGVEWLGSAALLGAVLRRGTAIGDVLATRPWTLVAAQWVIVVAELLSPLLLVRGRLGRVAVLVAYAFHAAVFLTVRIVFLPHCVAMLAFLPLERLGRQAAPSDAGVSLAASSSMAR